MFGKLLNYIKDKWKEYNYEVTLPSTFDGPFEKELYLDVFVQNPKTKEYKGLACLIDPDAKYDLILPWKIAEELGLKPSDAKEVKKISFLGGNSQEMTKIDEKNYCLICTSPVKGPEGEILMTETTAHDIFVYKELMLGTKIITAEEPVIVGGFVLMGLNLEIHYDEENDTYNLHMIEGLKGLKTWNLPSDFKLEHLVTLK